MSFTAPYKVLCVCLGNICRSPTAEVVLRHFCDAHQLNIEIDSAGTSNYHPNKAPDLRSQEHALKRGYDLSSLRARQLQTRDFVHFDLILAMDHRNFDDIQALYQTAQTEFGINLSALKLHSCLNMTRSIRSKHYLILTMVALMVLNVFLTNVSRAAKRGSVFLNNNLNSN